ncbi:MULTISPECIES: hypothetical protein [unclassified Pseudomonas]|jgi:hypothetical protein|uniref:hypothetical protein n=1 Tax=unclassified Pseudomonas TaxID=196821 RepID=UPI000C14D7CD|nr:MULTISPECIES: hypothetical protein [unclassified Pseudomonas]MCF5229302.1 hypothetical protein [Pseudomonas sp. PA-5-4H]MCF5235855.1 hypothetical protein [Pseudomonas sp. PA-5-4G]MCF5247017.1 hypothetical protein [Pseudomonas sp. PA-5-4B]MCF5253684.1 hypothetical protein [Pseudomonas sp. PA-5-4B]MCF5258916.1 hypothetical protein [Pseudomonas sp. PA-5-4A]
MSNNTYLLIGALIVVALIAAAVIRSSKKKQAKPPVEAVAEPSVQVPPVTPDTGEWTLKLDDAPSTLPAQPAIQKGVEVWNQTDFHFFVTQQGIRATLPPQGRTLMDNSASLTVSPSAQNTLQSVALEETSPESSAQYTLIIR